MTGNASSNKVLHGNNSSFAHFLRSPCNPHYVDMHRVCGFEGSIRLNGKESHPSHHRSSYRGIFFCTRCGNLGHKQLSKLGHPCFLPVEEKTTHGRRVLERVSQGRLPPGITEWPDLAWHELQFDPAGTALTEEESRAKQIRSKQSKAKKTKAEYSKAEQSKAKQRRAKQSNAKQ